MSVRLAPQPSNIQFLKKKTFQAGTNLALFHACKALPLSLVTITFTPYGQFSLPLFLTPLVLLSLLLFRTYAELNTKKKFL